MLRCFGEITAYIIRVTKFLQANA